jgi:BTB/POZ domain
MSIDLDRKAADALLAKVWDNDLQGVKDVLEANKLCINILPNPPEYSPLVSRASSIRHQITYTENMKDTHTPFSILHYAVLNIYHLCNASEKSLSDAIEIFNYLLDGGANPTIKPLGIIITYTSSKHTPITDGVTPLLLLNRFTTSNLYKNQPADIQQKLKDIAERLPRLEKEWTARLNKSVVVPNVVMEMYCKLRNSNTPDSMTFCCKDGVEVSAHPCILSASSSYFEAFFNGPWTYLHPDRRWNTEYTSIVINNILDFAYAGHVNHAAFIEHGIGLYKASAEFQFLGMNRVVADYLRSYLSLENVKETLSLAFLHEDTDLLAGCYDFIDKNFRKVMLDSSFVALSVENTDLWKALQDKMIVESNTG